MIAGQMSIQTVFLVILSQGVRLKRDTSLDSYQEKCVSVLFESHEYLNVASKDERKILSALSQMWGQWGLFLWFIFSEVMVNLRP